MNKTTIHIALFVIVMIFSQLSCFSQNTDTIVHVNGSYLKGNFKKMEYGIITWKMDGMGTISVEEPFVSTIISQKQFELIMKDGTIHYSSFEASESEGEVLIEENGEKVSVMIDDIVEIHPMKGNFWQKFTGNISLGGNFSKSNNLTTIAFSGNLDWRNRKTAFFTDWILNLSFQGDSTITNNSETDVNWQHLFKNKWSSVISLGRSQNLQLGIKQRYNLSVGALKDMVNNTWSRFYIVGALTAITEQSFDTSSESIHDVAGLIRLSYYIFKYTKPKISMKSNVSVIPYITGEDRTRINFNLNPNVSIINNNFKVGFSFYYTYDTRPAVSSLSNEDYGINLQLTYKIN